MSRGPRPVEQVTLMWVPDGAQGEVRRATLRLPQARLAMAALGALLVLLALSALRGWTSGGGESMLLDENLALKRRLMHLEGRLDGVDAELQRLRLYDQQIGGPTLAPDEGPALPGEAEGTGPFDAEEAEAGGLHSDPGRLLRRGEAGDPMDELVPAGDIDGRLERADLRLDALAQHLGQLEQRLGGLAEEAEGWRSVAPGLPSAWPLQGVLTSGFGWRRSPFTRQWKFHLGVDIAAPRGTVIVAPSAGRVVRAEFAEGYGRVVEINHGEGVITRYGHNARLLVRDGQAVRAGQAIATVGMTGHTTGPHLHYEIYVDGQAVDPLEVLE